MKKTLLFLPFLLCAIKGSSQTSPDYVTVDVNKFTVQQLVQDVLVNSPCLNVSSITSSASCGIGYFNRNSSDFPIKEGMLIRCGNAQATQGKYDGTNLHTECSGVTDADLNAIINKGYVNAELLDASSVKFNFVAAGNKLSFRYLFASNEYGTYQCGYGDALAFILTDLTAGMPSKNLAVIPGTATPGYDDNPVCTGYIRQQKYNEGCTSKSPQLFGQYNEYPAANVAASDINMKGQTVVMTASADIIPGHQYSIKLVIGDYGDYSDSKWADSAVFIEAGSFEIGQPSIVSEEGITDSFSFCDGNQYVLKSGTTKLPGIIYSWKLNGVVIPGENNYFITISKPGKYTITNTYQATGCEQSDDFTVIANTPILQEPNDLYAYNGLSKIFDLSKNVPTVLGSYKPDDFDINYFHSIADAYTKTDPIVNYTTYSGIEGESVFMTVEYLGSPVNCTPIKTFKLHFVWETLGLDDVAVSNLTYNPNPVKDVLNINSGEMIESVSVINMLGQELFRSNYNLSNLQVDMSSLSAGAYFVKVRAGQRQSVFKIIKE